MVKYNMGVINRSLLVSGITGASTTMQVSAGGGAQFPATPFLLALTADLSQASLDVAEYVEIINVATDILTFGDRDIEGQAASQTHVAGTMVVEVWQPRHLVSIQQDTLDLEFALVHIAGTVETGVKVWAPNYNQLNVTESGPPAMTVDVVVGFGFRDGILGRLASAHTTDTIVAPSTSARKDLVSMNTILKKIIVITGVEGSGIPATPARHFALAEIDLIVSQSTIVNGDITDVRVQI